MSKEMTQLREQLSNKNREAKALLAEKGSSTWTVEDQKKFDNYTNEMDLLESQLAAHQKLMDADADDYFNDVKSNNSVEHKDAAKQGYELFMRKSRDQITPDERALILNVMSTNPGADGGFTIEQTDVAGDIIEEIKHFGTMRKVASQITTSRGEKMSWPTTSAADEEGEIVGENKKVGSQGIQFGTRSLEVFKFSSKIIPISMELLQDSSVDVVQLIHSRMGQRIGRIQDRLFTNGTGSEQPMGLFTAAQVGVVGASGSATTVTYDGLVDLTESLDQIYLEGASSLGWMFNQETRKIVRKLKDENGRPIWTPSYDAGVTEKTPDYLLSYPVHINNQVARAEANAKSIAFGDYSSYRIRDAMDIQIFRFEDSAYTQLGQVGFLAFCRAGGNLMDVNAVKLFQHSAD